MSVRGRDVFWFVAGWLLASTFCVLVVELLGDWFKVYP